MDNNSLQDLLAAHAEALNQGQEGVSQLLQSYPSLPPNGRPLLALAWQLKRALVPVPVPASFKAELRQSLLSAAGGERQAPMVVGRGGRRPLWMGAAAVGSLLPLLGLLLFWRRRQRTHPLAGAT